MKESAKKLDFEEAAKLRDRIKELRQKPAGNRSTSAMIHYLSWNIYASSIGLVEGPRILQQLRILASNKNISFQVKAGTEL